MEKDETLLEHIDVLILTTCSPADDPRSLHWANSCVELYGGRCCIVYPSRGRWSFFRDVNKQTVGKIDLVSFNLGSFSRKKVWALLDNVDSAQTLQLVDWLETSIKSDSTDIHRTLAEQCLDEIVIAVLSRLTFVNPQIIVGTDIKGLCGISVFNKSGAQAIYDAQEITIYGFPGLSEVEIEFWKDIEKRQLFENLKAVTVSPGIAKWHESEFDFVFDVVPNFEPLENGVKTSTLTKGPIKYVYYGGCAPVKNLRQLLMSWNISKEIATLCIVSQKNSDRLQLEDYWKSLIVKDSEVKFVSHDDATSVCKFLTQFDVGVIPYNYAYPYSEASPNKLGQYLAAGLAVVANQQGFVSELIADNGLGLVVDLSNPQEAAIQIEKISNQRTIDNFKVNSLRAFQDHLNWENHVKFLSHFTDIRYVSTEVSHLLGSDIRVMRAGLASRLVESVRYLMRTGVYRAITTRLGASVALKMSESRILNIPRRLLISMIEKRPH